MSLLFSLYKFLISVRMARSFFEVKAQNIKNVSQNSIFLMPEIGICLFFVSCMQPQGLILVSQLPNLDCYRYWKLLGFKKQVRNF